jgi:hypothetical protein
LNDETKKQRLIIVWPYRFREFDWQRFELEFLSENLEILIHELIDALTPEFAAAFANQSDSARITRFSSLKHWRREFRKLSKGAIVFSHLRPVNLETFLACVQLRFSRANVIAFSTGGVSFSSVRVNPDKRDLPAVIKKILHFVRRNLLRIAMPNFVVVGGSEEVKRVRRDFPRSTKVVLANSSDFSTTIRLMKNETVTSKSAIYLDTGFPGFPRDEIIEKTSETVQSEDWYPNLSKFFVGVEKALDVSVSISIHPKHVGRDHQPLFGNRETLGGQTAEVVSRCELVIATNSTAISYAIAFLKPLVLVTSDKIENSRDQYKWSLIQNISIDTGATIFNIDREYSEQELREALVIDHEKYESYKQKYLTSRTDGKPNYQVILEEIINAKH